MEVLAMEIRVEPKSQKTLVPCLSRPCLCLCLMVVLSSAGAEAECCD